MNLSFDANPAVYIIGFILSIGSSFYWIYKRRKQSSSSSNSSQARYTKTQILGILGIIFFMFPIFWIIITQLVKGLMVFLLLLFGFLHLSDTIENILIFIFQLASIFITIIGSYLVCEIVWPKKQNTI